MSADNNDKPTDHGPKKAVARATSTSAKKSAATAADATVDRENARRSQSRISAFLYWNALYLLSTACTLTLVVGPILYPRTLGMYVVLPYLTYTLLLRRDELTPGGNPWEWFTENFPAFRSMQRHLDLTFAPHPLPPGLVEAERRPDARFVFAVFPHGTNVDYRVVMDGMLRSVLPNVTRRIRVLSASILFRIPIVREVTLWTRCVDARRSVADAVLESGRSVMVMPGGMDEQIRTERGREAVYLRGRKGFVKLAMRHDVPVVPVYVFGCTDMFHTSGTMFGTRHWLMKRLGICVPLCAGMLGTACPLPVKTTVVFGEPLFFARGSEDEDGGTNIGGTKITEEELDAAHDKFCDALVALFDEHKDGLGYGDRTLEVV